MNDNQNKTLRSVIEWSDPDAELLFERWTEDGNEIKNASRLIVGPGQGCLFVYEGRIESVFTKEGSYELKTDNIPFWTNVKNAMYGMQSVHTVGIYFFRTGHIVNRRWGTPSSITYSDPKFKFPVGLGVFGNFSFSIVDPVEFFRRLVAGAHIYTVREIQKVLVSRITQPMSDFLASAAFGYVDIDSHRNEIAAHCLASSAPIFTGLGLELLDLRIEGTNFDEATQTRIGRIADMSAEAQALKEVGIDYAQHQQLQAMRDLARNEGGGNLGMQMGLGLEMAKQMKPSESDDIMQKLEKLKKMLEMQLITDEEFAAKKQELLTRL